EPKTGLLDGDTPITVGGGGGNRPPKRKPPLTEKYTKTVFDPKHFKDSSSSDEDKSYQNSGESARYILFDDGLGVQENLTRYLGDGDIIIEFFHSHDITITQHPFGVQFKLSENQPIANPPQGTQEHHNNADPKLKRINFENNKHWPKDGGNANVGDGWFICV